MASDPSLKGQQKVVRVGKYEVRAHIASGGMGAVYRAFDPESNREFALKVLTKDMAAKPAMLERFRREARHAAKLHHENIVRVYEFAEFKGTYYIVMEYVDGVDLADYLDQHAPLDPEETRQIMIQACRALKHAHEQGIVHRDVKPSNFLLAKRNGRLLVKLTDLGLAREVTNDEFRVTRAGTTVGTVDYLSPEQARESGSADIRSDLYSLGCTWFHMLAGQPPFSAGGLAERILKHMEEDPPDVRQFNPRASKALVEVLNKLLEKKPRDRYQTPVEALADLLSLDPIAKSHKETPRPHQAAVDVPGDVAPSSPRRVAKKGKSKGGQHGDTLADKRDTVETRGSNRILWIGATAFFGLALVAAVVLVVFLKWPRSTPVDDTPPEPDNHQLVDTRPTPPKVNPDPELRADPIVKTPPLPPLFQTKTPIDVAKLRERLDLAFPKQELANNEPPLTVQRTTGGETMTLAGALSKAAPERPITIEIADNGPLFWSTTAFSGRDVTLCAAKGYRPLIVWDVAKSTQEHAKTPGKPETAKPYTFLTVEQGRLHLEGIDVVVQWPDKFADTLTLVQTKDADFSARNCTFSLSGKHDKPVAAVRFVATKPEPRRCRFSACVLRGDSLQALDLDAPGALVLFENCLVAGGEFPLFQVRGGGEQPASLFAVRSTLVAGASLLRLQGDNAPSLNWLGWDSILSRSSDKAGGEMIVLPPAGTAAKIKWEAPNTLYAGWQMLLTGADPIRVEASATTWGRVMRWPVGDRAIADVWPPPLPDLAEVSSAQYRTAKTPVHFAASVNNLEPVGCVLDQLPPLRNNWKALAYDRVFVPPFDVLEDAAAPVIPLAGKSFTGQTLDVSKVDLGAFLQEMQRTRGFGPRVVMNLKGTGMQPMTPVKFKGVHLTLHFEQAADDAKRLALTLTPTAAGAALLEIDGGLDVSNGDFILPDGANKGVTEALFKVSGGDLRLYRCRLFGPQLSPSPNYRGLIQFEGSGDENSQKSHQCVVNESVLITDKTALQLQGVGARLLIKQSAIIAGGPALQVDLGLDFKGRANVQCVVTSSSIAARQSILQVEDIAAPGPVEEPIVIQSMQCAFQAPFKDAKSGVVRFGGDALAHGLFIWQSDSDLFDKRLQYGCLPLNAEPTKTGEWQTAWLNLFGSYAATHPRIDLALTRQVDATKNWTLDQLLLTSPKVWPDKPPTYGADLVGKGFVKKLKGM